MGFFEDFDLYDYLPDFDDFTPAGILAYRKARKNRRRARKLRRRQRALKTDARNLPRAYKKMAKKHLKNDLVPFRDAFNAIVATDMIDLDIDASPIDLDLTLPKVRKFDYVQWEGVDDTIEWITDILTLPIWGQRELVEQKRLAARIRHAKAQTRREEARLAAIKTNMRIGRKTLARISRRMRPLNTWLAQRVEADPDIRSFSAEELDALMLHRGLALAMTMVLQSRPIDEGTRRAKASKAYRRQVKDTGKAVGKKSAYRPPTQAPDETRET